MSEWLNESASRDAAIQRAQDRRSDRVLRMFDFGLALLALALLALPLTLAASVGRLQRLRLAGQGGKRFEEYSLRMPDSALGRLWRALGADRWPVLFNILRGEMAWVGPAPQTGVIDASEPRFLVRPGLTSLWDIRCRTAVDFGTEDAATLEYLAQRGLKHDLGLLGRAAFVRIFAAKRAVARGRVRICDVEFDNVNMEEALDRIEARLDHPAAHQVSFVNPACVNIAAKDRGYRRSLARAGLVLPDGIGTKIAGDMLGTPIKQNVNGTDLFPRLCDRLNSRGTRIFLLGGQPGIPQKVADVIKLRWPAIQVVGMRDGFFSTAEEGDVAEQVRASGAQFLLVARGVPVQDVFMDRYLDHFGVSVCMGVGGLFDFVAGRINRAPRWMRDVGLEWSYRLIQEPRRMWRRYLVGNFTFLARVMLQRLRLRHPADDTRPLAAGARSGHGELANVAVLMATSHCGPDIPMEASYPAALLPLGSQTFVEHAIVRLVGAGVRDIHLVVSERPEMFRRTLGDGGRWGARLTWHLAKDEGHALLVLPQIASTAWNRVIVARADRWIDAEAVEQLVRNPTFAECLDAAGNTQWAGWASLRPADLRHVAAHASLEALLGGAPRTRWLLGARQAAGCDTAADLLAAQRVFDGQEAEAAVPKSWLRMPWGYMSPQADVADGAVMTGPVIVGPGCMVERGARVGPDVLLERDVIVSAGSSIESSVVLAATFVGKGLEIRDTITHGSDVQHVGYGVRTQLPSAEGQLFTLRRTRGVTHPLERLVATLLLALLSPWTAIMALARHIAGSGPLWSVASVVGPRDGAGRAPGTRSLRLARSGLGRAAHTAAQFGPLMDVVVGQRRLLGARPRRAGEWYALHPDWQAQLAQAPVGVLVAPTWSDDPADAIESNAAADLYLLAQGRGRERLRVACEALRALWWPQSADASLPVSASRPA